MPVVIGQSNFLQCLSPSFSSFQFYERSTVSSGSFLSFPSTPNIQINHIHLTVRITNLYSHNKTIILIVRSEGVLSWSLHLEVYSEGGTEGRFWHGSKQQTKSNKTSNDQSDLLRKQVEPTNRTNQN